ncbi:MAG: hypothetical protein AB7F88_02975 [Pyrinomonadaceae bacterium]
MTHTELLKAGRDQLLSLHKSLVDLERTGYEGVHGEVTAAQFLSLLLENPDFAWLRKFSTLIVDIDEMFAQKDGFSDEAVEAHLSKLRSIVQMTGEDQDFIAKYERAIQQDIDVAAKQAELRRLLS